MSVVMFIPSDPELLYLLIFRSIQLAAPWDFFFWGSGGLVCFFLFSKHEEKTWR